MSEESNARSGHRNRAGAGAQEQAVHIGKSKFVGFKYFLWILPFLILVFLFSYFPLHGWIYSFYDYRPPRSLSQCEFVGLQWFKMLISNPTQVSQLLQVLKNTFAMSLLGIATSILPLFFAVFLNEIKCRKFKSFVQTFTTLPNFISWVLVFSVAFALFSANGMVNTFLQQIGFIDSPIRFLDSDSHTYLKMLLWNMWKSLGWGSIIYLASIAGIDQELYEAASIDGAGRFQKMFYITIPELLPTFFVMLMMAVSNFLNNGMDQYFVFQNSFNKEHIQVLDLYVYNIGMTGSSYSLATAISMLKSIVSIALLSLCNVVSKVTRGETIV
ncbi:MAG: ABC transporter permease subunit [Lachnospiraceae bacterium]|nr:ABC transporter permease subunit [Lachnospiraceae bacterium]